MIFIALKSFGFSSVLLLQWWERFYNLIKIYGRLA